MFNPGYSDTSHLPYEDYEQLYADARKQLAHGFDEKAKYYAAIGRDEISEIFRELSETNSTFVNDIETDPTAPISGGNIHGFGIHQLASSHVALPNVSSNYEAWAIVVQQESNLFDWLLAVAARTKNPVGKRWLLSKCEESMALLRKFRVQRRAAYHTLKALGQVFEFPRMQRIITVEDFRFVARAVENWFAEYLLQVSKTLPEIHSTAQNTKEFLTNAFNDLNEIAPPKNLRRALQVMEKAADTLQATKITRVQLSLMTMGEAKRVFDYYDSIFQSTQDPDILTESQLMSVLAVERLQKIQQDVGSLSRIIK